MKISNIELLQIIGERFAEDADFLGAVKQLLENFEQNNWPAMLTQYPTKGARRRGRPTEIDAKMEELIRHTFGSVDDQAKAIFKFRTHSQREAKMIQEFGTHAKRLIDRGNVFVTSEGLRNAILAAQCGIAVRVLEDYLRDNQRTIKAKHDLQFHPDVISLDMTGRGRRTRIDVTAEKITPDLQRLLDRHHATVKVANLPDRRNDRNPRVHSNQTRPKRRK